MKKKKQKFVLCPVLVTEGKIGSFHMVGVQHARWFLSEQAPPLCLGSGKPHGLLTDVMVETGHSHGYCSGLNPTGSCLAFLSPDDRSSEFPVVQSLLLKLGP